MEPCWRKDGSRGFSRLVDIDSSSSEDRDEDEEEEEQQQQQLQHENAADTFEGTTVSSSSSSSSSSVFASTRARDNERNFGLQVDLTHKLPLARARSLFLSLCLSPCV
jgi:hypothetical protein